MNLVFDADTRIVCRPKWLTAIILPVRVGEVEGIKSCKNTGVIPF